MESKKGKAATDEDFADRKKEIEKIWNPLVSKAYGGGGGGGDDGDEGGGDGGGDDDSGPDEL